MPEAKIYAPKQRTIPGPSAHRPTARRGREAAPGGSTMTTPARSTAPGVRKLARISCSATNLDGAACPPRPTRGWRLDQRAVFFGTGVREESRGPFTRPGGGVGRMTVASLSQHLYKFAVELRKLAYTMPGGHEDPLIRLSERMIRCAAIEPDDD
jgi:hypothetical protein